MQVNEFLEISAKNFPEKVALVCQGARLTYKEINSKSNCLANVLISLGLNKQDRVGIYLENSVESVVSIFATLKAGGVFVVINPQVKAKKLRYILKDCQIRVLVTDLKHLQDNLDVLTDSNCLNTIIAAENIPDSISINKKLLFYSEVIAKFDNSKPQNKSVDTDLASLIYTSGSTGRPKGVMLTHLNMVSAASSIIQYLENTSDDIVLDCLPLSFDYGLYQVLMAFKFGGTVVLEQSFIYPYQIIDRIVKEKVTGFPVVPTILAILLQLKNLSKVDFSHLRYITNTAQALPEKYISLLKEYFPWVKIYSMYGLTECKRVSYLAPEQLTKKPTSVGKAMPNTEVWLVDEQDNKITEAGIIGELVVRGPNVMQGYWNLPEETAKRIKYWRDSRERVLYTGDLFKMDEEGDLYFVSRKDDIIKTGGEMVSPKEVENILSGLDAVMEAAVIGVNDEILGKAIKAYIVLREGSKLTEKNVLLHCQKHLENFMVPKYVEFRKDLPKTTTGKISKRDLVEAT